MNRRSWLSLALLAAFADARADDAPFPAKPIKIITITPPGAASDIVARFIAEELRKETGAQFVVDNRPGAMGVIASEAVMRANPDGYTILLSGTSTHAQNPFLIKHLAYDPVLSFEPICRLTQLDWVLVANPDMGFHNLKELVALAKASPQKYSYAYGTTTALAVSKALTSFVGIDVLPVAYKANVPALTDIIAGRVSFMFLDVANAAPLINAGKLLGLAVASEKRSDTIAQVPTLREEGVTGVDFIPWTGIWAPARTPAPVVRWFSANLQRILARPGSAEVLKRVGMRPAFLAPEAYAAFIQDELDMWGKRLAAAGIQPE